jgi:hypothetical protein
VGLVVGDSIRLHTNHGTSFEPMPRVNLTAAEPDSENGVLPRRAIGLPPQCRPEVLVQSFSPYAADKRE